MACGPDSDCLTQEDNQGTESEEAGGRRGKPYQSSHEEVDEDQPNVAEDFVSLRRHQSLLSWVQGGEILGEAREGVNVQRVFISGALSPRGIECASPVDTKGVDESARSARPR